MKLFSNNTLTIQKMHTFIDILPEILTRVSYARRENCISNHIENQNTFTFPVVQTKMAPYNLRITIKFIAYLAIVCMERIKTKPKIIHIFKTL